MSVRKWMFAGALLLAAGLSSLGFAQKPGLKFNPDKKFKIVQFTDLHVKWQDPRSDIAFERMNQVLDDEKPDLVIFTGDIIYSKPALENMRNVLKTVSDRKIPFSIVFGNHDNEQGATKEELLKVAESLPYSLTADEVPEISGVGNYALTVRSSDGKKDAFVLYCIDSNTYSTIKGVKGYDYIKRDQIDWYCKKSAEFTRNNGGEPVPSLAFSSSSVQIMKAFSLASLKDLAPLQPDHPLLLLNFLHLLLDPLRSQIHLPLQTLLFRQILPLRQKLSLFLKGLRLLLLLRFQFPLFQLLPLFQALFFLNILCFFFARLTIL